MKALTIAARCECPIDDEPGPRHDVLLFMKEAGVCSWYVRAEGRTIAGGGADDLELARLKAERYIEDRRVGLVDA